MLEIGDTKPWVSVPSILPFTKVLGHVKHDNVEILRILSRGLTGLESQFYYFNIGSHILTLLKYANMDLGSVTDCYSLMTNW